MWDWCVQNDAPDTKVVTLHWRGLPVVEISDDGCLSGTWSPFSVDGGPSGGVLGEAKAVVAKGKRGQVTFVRGYAFLGSEILVPAVLEVVLVCCQDWIMCKDF